MALKSLLITKQEVKDIAFTQANFDTGLILDYVIRAAQLSMIKPILTEDLYDLIENENDSNSLSSANSTLLTDYIKPALAFAVKHEVLPNIMLKATNLGIATNNSQFTNSVSSAQREELRSNCFEHYSTYIDAMKVFIDDNISDYTTYNKGKDVTEDVRIIGGIVFEANDNCRHHDIDNDGNYC